MTTTINPPPLHPESSVIHSSGPIALHPEEEQSDESIVIAAVPDIAQASSAPGNPNYTGTSRSASAGLFTIKPHSDMYNPDHTGKMGDEIVSAQPGSMVKHFVTPKSTTELPDPLIFQAAGLSADDFKEGPNDEPPRYSWVCEKGNVGTSENLWVVSRADAERVRLKIVGRSAGEAEMIVWIVWAPVIRKHHGHGVAVDVPTDSGNGSRSGCEWSFEAIIQPPSIVVGPEIPNLKGAAETDTPEVSIGAHALDGARFLRPGAKWDLSRCWRAKTFAGSLTATDCDIKGGTKIAGDYPTGGAGKLHETSPNHAPDHYPKNKLEGNDYQKRTQNPYSSGGGSTPGKMVDFDTPRHFVKTMAGEIGHRVEVRYQFRSFSRLEINKKWYAISSRDDGPWRFLGKMRKVSEHTDQEDYNNDGDKVDELWINDVTESDKTDLGF